MEKVYVLVINGLVREIIRATIDINELYTPEFVQMLVEVTDLPVTPEEDWTASNADGVWSFAAPVPYVPTPAEVKAKNTITRDQLLRYAAESIAPLQYAVELEMATEEETAALKKWKIYSISVNRVDLSATQPEWPSVPFQ